ncbi:unnamed protein product [Paramecium pentaurelia]|uniref:Uncharacterized protein n=1 Tax=Paramecium pentaurelia TaxID=43138 RepID=A0A8S1SSY3_9CILI|nr:unnamed protein product [Paramecium pentaurelia]
MDNYEQVLFLNPTQLQSVQNQFENINKQVIQLYGKVLTVSQLKKYKKVYSLLSKFLDRYDHTNQIHLNDRIHFLNILLMALNKIFKKSILKDMSKKNLIDIKVWKQKLTKYIEIYPILISKITSNLELATADPKQRIREQLRNSIFKDQLEQQIQIINTSGQLKLDQITIPFQLTQEFETYLKSIMIAYRLQSYYPEIKPNEKLKFAILSYDVSKIIMQSKGKRVSKLCQYILSSINLLNRYFESKDDQCSQIIDEVNHSEALKYLIFLVQQTDAQTDFKSKLKCKWKFSKLLKPLIWFWIQSIYYYQSKFKFEKCQDIMGVLKWLSYHYLISTDELSIYVQNIQAITFAKNKENIIFNQILEQIYLNEDIGMPRIKNLFEQNNAQQQELQNQKQTINYYYNQNNKDNISQPEYFYCRPNAQIKLAHNSELAFIEINNENFSSIDTRLSSNTLRLPKKDNTSIHGSKSFRGSLSQFSNSFSDKKIQNQIQQIQPQSQTNAKPTTSFLDKMIKKMIENKIMIDDIQCKETQLLQLLSKEKLQQKESDFYKKLLRFKTQFSKFVLPVKLKSKQEVITKQDLQMRVINKQIHVDNLNAKPNQTQTKQNDLDNSLLSFEKPGAKLGPLQKLKKIIFQHPEVFSLQKFRNKLKSSKKWYNRSNSVRMTNARRSVMIMKTKEQHIQELNSLRQRSISQLKKNISETQLNIQNVDKELRSKSVRFRQFRQNTEQPFQIENRYQNLSKSITKLDQTKKII